MSGKMPWLRLTTVSAGIMMLGYGVMKATVPSPEDTYNAMSPDLRRKVDANRAARIALEQGIRQQQDIQNVDPHSAKPVWADPKAK